MILEGQQFKLLFRISLTQKENARGLQLDVRRTMMEHADWIHVVSAAGEATSTITADLELSSEGSTKPVFYFFVRDIRAVRNEIPCFTTKKVTSRLCARKNLRFVCDSLVKFERCKPSIFQKLIFPSRGRASSAHHLIFHLSN